MPTKHPQSPARAAGSITHLGEQDRGAHVCTGSHGGLAVGNYALFHGFRSLTCHDAGVGLDEAGIAALDLLDGHGIPAAAVDFRTARIGDGDDMLARGSLSHVNDVAAGLGLEKGMTCADAFARIQNGAAAVEPPDFGEIKLVPFERHTLDLPTPHGAPPPFKAFALDSASSITASDTGQIVVTGSHGGLPGGRIENAAKARVFLAAFNDAGVGIDDAGISRLPALDRMDVAGVTVSCWSARIGDGRSTYETGLISHFNEKARTLGAKTEMPLAEFVDLLVRNFSKENS